MSTRVLGGICTHDEGCSGEYRARGLCRRHYAQWYRSPDFVTTVQEAPPVCVCDVPLNVTAFGECQACRRPYRQETFAATRAAWRAHLGLSPDAASAERYGQGRTPLPALPTIDSQ